MGFFNRKITVLSILLGVTLSVFGQKSHPGNQSSLIDLKQGVFFEVSPYTGAMQGSGLFGLRLAMNYGSLNFEFGAEQVLGETANLYPLTLNLTLNFSTRGPLLPYGTVGGGLMMTTPTNAIGAETVSTIGVNFGGGVRYYFNKSFGVRLEAKQYMTNVTNELHSRDELLMFQEISAGVTFIFH